MFCAVGHAGADPHATAQTYQELQAGKPCYPPLGVTAETDTAQSREAWRALFRDVFGL
jgi:hypothetical protein